jgi:hypothetical protein
LCKRVESKQHANEEILAVQVFTRRRGSNVYSRLVDPPAKAAESGVEEPEVKEEEVPPEPRIQEGTSGNNAGGI